MRKNISLLLVAAATLLTVTSCRGTKGNINTTTTTVTTTAGTMTASQRAEAVVGNLLPWQTLQVSGKVRLSAGNNFTSSMQLRMVRGRYINISLRPVLGIEVGRLVVTGDSIFVIDKVHKRYVAESLSLLTGGLPLTVADAQDLFLGRAFVLGEGTVMSSGSVEATVGEGNTLSLRPTHRQREFDYRFNYDTLNRIQTLEVTPSRHGKSTSYHVDYDDVRATAAGDVAHRLSAASLIDGHDMRLQLEYNDITWGATFKVDTTVPANYKRMEASQLLNLF